MGLNRWAAHATRPPTFAAGSRTKKQRGWRRCQCWFHHSSSRSRCYPAPRPERGEQTRERTTRSRRSFSSRPARRTRRVMAGDPPASVLTIPRRARQSPGADRLRQPREPPSRATTSIARRRPDWRVASAARSITSCAVFGTAEHVDQTTLSLTRGNMLHAPHESSPEPSAASGPASLHTTRVRRKHALRPSRHRALTFCLGMIVSENRRTFFGIML